MRREGLVEVVVVDAQQVLDPVDLVLTGHAETEPHQVSGSSQPVDGFFQGEGPGPATAIAIGRAVDDHSAVLPPPG